MLISKFIRKEKILFYWFIASALIIIIRLLLINTKEFFSLGFEIGNILSTLSSGYIISYIFYFLVVFKKSQNDKKNISEFLVKYLSFLVMWAYHDFNQLKEYSNVSNLEFPPNEIDLINALKQLKLLNPPDIINHNYFFSKRILVEISMKEIEEIWKIIPFLDTELINLLNSLKECQLFSSICGISKRIYGVNESLIDIEEDISISKNILEYYLIINKLEKHLSLNFNEFKDYTVKRKNEFNGNF